MKQAMNLIIKIFTFSVFAVVVMFLFLSVYTFGYSHGVNEGTASTKIKFESLLTSLSGKQATISSTIPTPSPTFAPQDSDVVKQPPNVNWSGPELWEVVNARRITYGVGELKQKDEICTIASIRLNELIARGGLDAHEGFSSLPDRREDLKWIYETYSLAEFLVQGATSATEAVDLWENTLGHKKLLTGGEYVWGCTYAQNGIGVAIAGY